MRWVCVNPKALAAGPCTSETGGRPGTLHAGCGWVDPHPHQYIEDELLREKE